MAQVLHPERRPETDTLQAHALIKLARYTDVLELIESWPPGPEKDAAEAMSRLALGQTWRSRPPLRRLISNHSFDGFFRLAELRAFCFEIDESFEMLGELNEVLRQAGDHDSMMPVFFSNVAWSPFFEPMRDDPRWQEWLQQFRALTLDADAAKSAGKSVRSAGTGSTPKAKSVR